MSVFNAPLFAGSIDPPAQGAVTDLVFIGLV